MKKIILTILSLAAVSLAGVNGQIVMTYAFTNNSAATTGGIAENFSLSNFSVGNSLGTVSAPINSSSASTGYGSGLPTASGGGNIGNAFRIGALDTTQSGYIQFTLTPATGYRVSLTTFDFGTRSTSTGATTFALRSSADSYATDIFASTAITANSTWQYRSNSFTYSSADDTAITFRLFGYGGSGSPSSGTINTRFDDVSMTVAAELIPEPSTWALIGVGSAFVLWRIRSRRKNA